MEKSFWLDAWKEGRTRFHRDEPNPDLVTYLPRFSSHRSVFVPLCGKSVDLLFLRSKGFEVMGVELSEIAIQQFEQENKLQLSTLPHRDFTIYEMPNLQLYHGDLFDLSATELDGISFCYDRASLVALPLELREKYYLRLIGFQSIKEILLISFEYDQTKCEGPPFSVEEQEIRDHLKNDFKIDVLDRRLVEDLNPKFVEAGLQEFWRVVYHLKRQ